MFFLKQDGKKATRDYHKAGIWELKKAAELCLKEPNHDAMLSPDSSGKWMVVIPETVGILFPK